MSRFRDELRVIPRTVTCIAVLMYLVGATVLLKLEHNLDLKTWPLVGQMGLIYGSCLVLLVLILLIGYIYGDAKRREMRYILWTLLAIFLPDAIGIILYFILRDPLPRVCPSCTKRARAGFVFCPHCGTALLPRCPQCGRGVESSWTHCPQCGTTLSSHGYAAPQPG